MKNVDVESVHTGSRSAHPGVTSAGNGRRSRISTHESRTEQYDAVHLPPFDRATTATVDGAIDMAYAGILKITPLTAGGEVRHARYVGRDFLLDEVLFGGRYRLDVEPGRGALVAQLVSGTARYLEPGEAVDLQPGQPILASAELPCTLDVEHARLRSTAIDRSLLRRVAAEHSGSAVGRIQFSANRTANRAKAEDWNHALRFVTDSVSRVDAAAQSLITGACAGVLAASVLTCFPNNAVAALADGISDAGASHQLRRAMSFVEEHAGDDIGVTDIAAAVHLSPRAVQYLFRRHFDMAPSQYVRNIRLDHAHQDLVTSDRSYTTVSDVAVRWGFGHTGRFAVLYRQTYGQSPHVTLRG